MIHLRKLAQLFRRVIATLVRVGAPQSVALDSGMTLAPRRPWHRVGATVAKATIATAVVTILMGSTFVLAVPPGDSERDSHSIPSTHVHSDDEPPCVECRSDQKCSIDPEYRDWSACIIFEEYGEQWCNHVAWEGDECEPFALAPIRSLDDEYVCSTATAGTYAAVEEDQLLGGGCTNRDDAATGTTVAEALR